MPDPTLPTERELLAGAVFLHNSISADMTSWVMRFRIAAEQSHAAQQILSCIAPLEGGAAIADMMQANTDLVALGLGDNSQVLWARIRIFVYAALSGHAFLARGCAQACLLHGISEPWERAWADLYQHLEEQDIEAGERSAQLHKYKRADDAYAQQNRRHLLKFAGVES
ncbi:hypothetical protein FHR90_002112 [Endobacter medicaginis]|uniref:Uncharacterized protein n=1 Tax=Endobacter medicaginis TaxID=1181271 RepID=A0A839UWW4_9PROT|nr:hypothetical protein [Endobacter medicaginis]MBB3174276.1 hypothetical protein [Endobacter medicaginis]MCX5476826.1 hypothetical protein [Endobacter medicaginis]NVN31248.1 hypothetical protein [Endobacter medicaginis]